MGLVTLFFIVFTEILLRMAHPALLLCAATTCLAVHSRTRSVTLWMRERTCRIVTVLLSRCVATLRRLLCLPDLLCHHRSKSRLSKHNLLKSWMCRSSYWSRKGTCLQLCKKCIPLERSHVKRCRELHHLCIQLENLCVQLLIDSLEYLCTCNQHGILGHTRVLLLDSRLCARCNQGAHMLARAFGNATFGAILTHCRTRNVACRVPIKASLAVAVLASGGVATVDRTRINRLGLLCRRSRAIGSNLMDYNDSVVDHLARCNHCIGSCLPIGGGIINNGKSVLNGRHL